MISLYASRIHTTYFAVISAPVNIFKGKLSGQETFIAREEVGVSGGVGSFLGELHVFQGSGVRISQLTANQLLMGRGGGILRL